MASTWLCLTSLLALASSVQAHPGHNHAHIARSLASRTSPSDHAWWHRDESHFAHKLFKRGPTTDGITYPEVGSPTWAAAYPTSTPDSSQMPQEWKDALDAAVKAGTIPDLAPSTNDPAAGPVYPKGVDPMDPKVCSATYKCRLDTDLWDAPDGQVGISFDDGPIPESSDVLYQFLQENNIKATHFFIGVNILWGSKEFMTAYETLQDDIAVHTWTHPYMTTLSNEDVVAQLGWTMEIIHNSTGGRIPRFWRPPYGDSDIRVSAIAREVFGLKTVIWNQDTEDWSMATTDLTLQSVENSLHGWYAGPKSPGLIILEHELTNDTVGAFINTFPAAMSAGWKAVSVAQLDGLNTPYQNAEGAEGQPTVANIIVDASASSSTAASTAGSSATASASGSSSNHASASASGSGSSAAPSGTAASDSAVHTSDATGLQHPLALVAGSTVLISSLIANLL
ncbi:unnamed protein product [Peniophora sp. CBMAI 1063]|nr:unnamed protein product [Peniophora sp. CBMAI 1063]